MYAGVRIDPTVITRTSGMGLLFEVYAIWPADDRKVVSQTYAPAYYIQSRKASM